jgi:uncharacterized repeat protein (TIGR01451 family)
MLNPAGTEITWSGTLTAGHAITVSFTVVNDAVIGTVENVAEFVGMVTGGSDVASFDVITEPGTHVSKQVTPSAAKPGQTVAYTILLQNTGYADDTVMLTDTLPSEVVFDEWLTMPAGTILSLDETEIGWTGTLTAGGTLTWTFSVTNTVASGTVTNTVTFAGLKDSGSDAAAFEAMKWQVLMPLIFRLYTP